LVCMIIRDEDKEESEKNFTIGWCYANECGFVVRLAAINKLVRSRERERNGSRRERRERKDRSRRTIVRVSEEWVACMHARDGRG
jgi:hypothetical protein